MMRRVFSHFTLALVGLFSAASILSASPMVTAIQDPGLRGEATFRYLGLPIYQARLYTPRGEALNWSRDFGLELQYLRSVRARALVEGTLNELERIGHDIPRRSVLEQCFDDVTKGDRYLAVTRGPDTLRFWRNEAPVCTLSYPDAARDFMSIFLGGNTRSAAFTSKLHGR